MHCKIKNKTRNPENGRQKKRTVSIYIPRSSFYAIPTIRRVVCVCVFSTIRLLVIKKIATISNSSCVRERARGHVFVYVDVCIHANFTSDSVNN